MTNSRRTDRWLFDVWAVECHTCAADPGEPCTTLRGRARELQRMHSHQARWDLAKAAYLRRS